MDGTVAPLRQTDSPGKRGIVNHSRRICLPEKVSGLLLSYIINIKYFYFFSYMSIFCCTQLTIGHAERWTRHLT